MGCRESLYPAQYKPDDTSGSDRDGSDAYCQRQERLTPMALFEAIQQPSEQAPDGHSRLLIRDYGASCSLR